MEALCSARRVFLHGKNASSSMAQLLYFRLRRLGLQVSLLPSGGSELLEGLAQAAEGDLVVLFSFSKLSREGRILLDHSRSAGYRTLAFVGRTCLPAEERADISLFAYRGTEKSTIPWRPQPPCWMRWRLLWRSGWEPKAPNAFSRCIG